MVEPGIKMVAACSTSHLRKMRCVCLNFLSPGQLFLKLNAYCFPGPDSISYQNCNTYSKYSGTYYISDKFLTLIFKVH